MTLQTLRIGAVGAGRIGSSHIENLASTRHVQVVAVCTPVQREQEWVRSVVPDATIYEDIESLVKDPTVDAVWISSPTSFHEFHVSTALEHGKHVFCEKPIAGNEESAWRVYELSLKYPHLKVACGFVRRFADVYIAARDEIASGSIGEVISVFSRTTDKFDPSEQFVNYIKVSGGIFLDCNIHDIDVALFLAGGDPKARSAVATGSTKVYPKFAAFGDVDNGHGLVTFDNGLVFSLYGSRDNRHGHHSMTEVIGTKGRIVINGEPRGLNLDISNVNGTTMYPAADHFALFEQAFRNEVVAFRDWVLFDKNNGFNLKDAAKAVSIGQALQKSLKVGIVQL